MNVRNRRQNLVRVALRLAVFGVLTGASLAYAEPPASLGAPPPPEKAAMDKGRAPQDVSGVVDGYNYSPRGTVSSIVIKGSDHVAQLNVPPDMGAAVAAVATVGQSVQASAIPEVVAGDRQIFRLVSLTVAGKQYTLGRPDDRKMQHVEGSVKQLNYTPRGEMDGAILDSGDLVLVGPGAAASIQLSMGQKLTVDGMGHATFDGHQVIEAEKVNGTAIERPRPERRGPGEDGHRPAFDGEGRGGPGGPGGPHGAGERGEHGGPDGHDGPPGPPPAPGE